MPIEQDNGHIETHALSHVQPANGEQQNALVPTTRRSIVEDVPQQDPFEGKKLKIVLCLEGGGARGIVHPAAYSEIMRSSDDKERAVENSLYRYWPKYEIVGVAGTSSGALMASLIAAQYTPDEILKQVGTGFHSKAMQDAGFVDALSIFSDNDRNRFLWIRRFFQKPKETAAFLASLWLATGLLILLIILFAPMPSAIPSVLDKSDFFIRTVLLVVLGGAYAIGTMLFLQKRVESALKGFCETKTLAEGIDRALAAQLERNGHGNWSTEVKNEVPYRKKVKFKDLPLPLSVVATNIWSKKIEHFSTDVLSDTFVCDAVAASMALPVIFKAVNINNEIFCDGGVTSNFPSWTFDVKRAIDPDIYTIGIEILSPAKLRKKSNWQPYLNAVDVFEAIFFGRRRLETRMTRHVGVEMVSTLDLLDFDIAEAEIGKQLEDAKHKFQFEMTRRTYWRRMLQTTSHAICKLVDQRLVGTPDERGKIRVSVLRRSKQRGSYLSTIWMYSSDGAFENEPDDRQIYPFRFSRPGRAYRAFDVEFFNFEQRAGQRGAGMFWHRCSASQPNPHRYRERMTSPDIAWSLSVPIGRDGAKRPQFVIHVDSNIDIRDFDLNPTDNYDPEFVALIAEIRKTAAVLLELDTVAFKKAKAACG